MKKILWFNIIIVILFMLTGSFYETVYANSPAAKIVLALIFPFVISFYLCSVVYSCFYSLFYCIKKRNLKMSLPMFVFFIGFISYFIFIDSDGFWYRVIDYYKACI